MSIEWPGINLSHALVCPIDMMPEHVDQCLLHRHIPPTRAAMNRHYQAGRPGRKSRPASEFHVQPKEAL